MIIKATGINSLYYNFENIRSNKIGVVKILLEVFGCLLSLTMAIHRGWPFNCSLEISRFEEVTFRNQSNDGLVLPSSNTIM